MLSSVLLVTGAFVAYWAFKIITGLRRNIARAKSTGLPYYVIRKWRPCVGSFARNSPVSSRESDQQHSPNLRFYLGPVMEATHSEEILGRYSRVR